LSTFAKNVYSQFGEDGILAAVFGKIGEGSRTCVEFGAWDGRYLSNTGHLVEQGWRGVFIEGHPERFRDLEKSYAGNPRVTTLNRYVEADPNSESALTNLLNAAAVPTDFDLLSIDIDGNDYHIWKTLAPEFMPRVVVIEFNPSIPNDIIFIQDSVPSLHQGSSLAALVELGREKGYELVATTDCNAFFVRSSLFAQFDIADNGIDAIHKPEHTTSFFQLYDGTIMLAGCQRLLWHDIPIELEMMQVLPPQQRRYPDAVVGATDADSPDIARDTSAMSREDALRRSIQKLEQDIVEKERVIRELDAASRERLAVIEQFVRRDAEVAARRQDILDKERVIQELHAASTERLAVIEEFVRRDAEISARRQDLIEKERVIQELDAASKERLAVIEEFVRRDAEIAARRQDLIEKERVIQELDTASKERLAIINEFVARDARMSSRRHDLSENEGIDTASQERLAVIE